MQCVCASLLLCVTQLNTEGEVIRIGRLHITHNLCSHERHFSLRPSLAHMFTWFSDWLVAA